MLAAGAMAQQPEPSTYLSTFGTWTWCVNGVWSPEECTWFTPALAEYVLLIGDRDGARGYNWSVDAETTAGALVSMRGYVPRHDNGFGWTEVMLTPGGVLVEGYTSAATTTGRRR